MCAKINHYWNEWRNIILLLIFLVPFQFFALYAVLDGIVVVWKMYYFVFFLESAAYFSISFIGYKYINKIAMCKKLVNHGSEDNEYSAVLIGNNLSWGKNVVTNVVACGLHLLIKYYRNVNKYYIICQKINQSDFDRFVFDDKCQELYIVGHGSKRYFRINTENDEKIYYSEYKDTPKKRVIAQLHCANTVIGENNESLVNLLATDKDNSYVGCGMIFFTNVWWYCFKMWRKNRPKK